MESLKACYTDRKDCLAVLGTIGVLYVTLKTLCLLWRGIKQFFLARMLGLGVNFRSLGAWAVVTGSTDGIGKAYAEQLARAGLNVVLISRSVEKLNNVAKEIETASKVQTKVIAVDFTGGPEIYTRIAQELAGLDIAVLVNNVGMSHDLPVYLAESSDQELRNIINVNCNAVTFMTKIVLPGMVEKRKGVIINISSLTGLHHVPLLSVYSATKAFVESFSFCIREEYKSRGIIVQCVAPGFVATKLAKIRKSSLMIPYADGFVRSALATVGVVNHTCGCLAHAIQEVVTGAVPERLYLSMSNSMMKGARARGLKKLEKKE